jgi:hypothetical protein
MNLVKKALTNVESVLKIDLKDSKLVNGIEILIFIIYGLVFFGLANIVSYFTNL